MVHPSHLVNGPFRLCLGILALIVLTGAFSLGCQKSVKSTAVQHPELQLIIWLDAPSKAKRGEELLFKLKIENRGNEPVTLWGPFGQYLLGFDFVVTQPGDKEIWRWSLDKVLLPALARITLQPSEGREFQGEWKQQDNSGNPIEPGSYLLKGMIKIQVSDKGQPEPLETKPWRLVIKP